MSMEQSETSAREHLLVGTLWLRDRLQDADLRILDIRGTILAPTAPQPWYKAERDSYEQAHIPGAQFVDWLVDIVDPAAPIKATVMQPDAFAALMSRLGIAPESTIVIYDDDGCHTAARLWWICRYYGHKDVRLLDGGWRKWIAEAHPTTTEIPAYASTQYQATIQGQHRAALAQVKEASLQGTAQLLDCRGPSMYRGEVTRGSRKGHIPGALNLPWSDLLEGPYNTFRDNAQLLALLQKAGIDTDKPTITYCNAGVSASVGLFALHLLGLGNGSNYDGSWYEWESNPEHPIASAT